MRYLDKVLFWFLVQIGIIALLYHIGFIPSHLVLDRLTWGGNTGFKWALNYTLKVVPLCVITCLIYTIVGVVVTKKVPIHSKKWWTITSIFYLTFLTISGVWAFLATGYAFYNSYGFAIIDIWIAPLLWLGEVELFLWLVNKWGDKPFMVKLITGLQKGIKWILIQYVVLALIVLVFLLTGVLDELSEDADAAFHFTLLGFAYSLPFCTLLFAWWNSFLPDRKHYWTILVPWVVIVIIGILSASFSSYIAENGLNVFHKICLIAGGALVPAFGAGIQSFVWLIRIIGHKNKIRKG